MLFYISAAAVFAAFAATGIIGASRVKSAADYAVAGRSAGTLRVASSIIGVIVAGGATVGTVQMSYDVGLSAWWLTLGSAVGCLLLGLLFARVLRRSGLTTLSAFLGQHYGEGMAAVSAVSSVLGAFMALLTQFLAGRALLMNAADISEESATAVLSVLILSFIFSGGLKSFGAVSALKTLLVAVMLVSCAAASVFSLDRGLFRIAEILPFDPWLNMFAGSRLTHLTVLFNIVTGIICSQFYTQAIMSARSEESARRGCIAAAAGALPLGFMCVWTGMAMRSAGIEVESAQALPFFISGMFPTAVSGFFWGILAVVIIGGAAGNALGIATNLSSDIIPRVMTLLTRCGLRPGAGKNSLALGRAAVLCTIMAAACASMFVGGKLMVELSITGLGLRSSFAFVPLVCAAFFPGRLSPAGALLTSGIGFAAVICTWFYPEWLSFFGTDGADPIFVGAVFSALTAICSCLLKHRSSK